MRDCLVNDAPQVLDFRPETWGELLDGLDRALGAERRVVTAVRFDGVDAPSFREPAQGGRPLSTVTRVEVEAMDAAVLVGEALGAAADSLPALADGARATAAAYRTGDPTAHGQLTALVSAIQSLVALTTAAESAARVAGVAVDATGTSVAASCRGVETALAALIDRHTRADWAGLAEALHGELAPAVHDWQRVLDAIHHGAAA